MKVWKKFQNVFKLQVLFSIMGVFFSWSFQDYFFLHLPDLQQHKLGCNSYNCCFYTLPLFPMCYPKIIFSSSLASSIMQPASQPGKNNLALILIFLLFSTSSLYCCSSSRSSAQIFGSNLWGKATATLRIDTLYSVRWMNQEASYKSTTMKRVQDWTSAVLFFLARCHYNACLLINILAFSPKYFCCRRPVHLMLQMAKHKPSRARDE